MFTDDITSKLHGTRCNKHQQPTNIPTCQITKIHEIQHIAKITIIILLTYLF